MSTINLKVIATEQMAMSMDLAEALRLFIWDYIELQGDPYYAKSCVADGVTVKLNGVEMVTAISGFWDETESGNLWLNISHAYFILTAYTGMSIRLEIPHSWFNWKPKEKTLEEIYRSVEQF
jgi:hypothetical protein